MASRPRPKKELLREREEGFDLAFAKNRLPEYNPLTDRSLRHHFENPHRQRHLHKMGLIDKEGRVVDIDKYKGKLFIIEQEFKHAEEAERRRIREEEELRERIRKKRFAALEEQRRLEMLARIKEDRRIRREMVLATAEARSGGLSTSFTRTGSRAQDADDDAFHDGEGEEERPGLEYPGEDGQADDER